MNWKQVVLDAGILREPSPDDKRLILWLSVHGPDGVRAWERISNVSGAEIAEANGLAATAATVIRAKQAGRGLFGKLMLTFRRTSDAPTWVLPSGGAVEQIGERQADLLLVWSTSAAGSVNEEALVERWPAATRRQRLGGNLFLLAGIEPPQPQPAAPRPATAPQAPSIAPAAPGANPREQAQNLLAVVRQAGDRRREALVLADLGVACQRSDDAQSAVPHLEAALSLAQEFGDQALASDVLGSLGLALVALGQLAPGLERVEQGLSAARASGNQFALKAALDNVGQVCAGTRNPGRAHAAFEEALTLARAVGDRPHQADMLWCVAIQLAELGQRDPALAQGRAAIDLYQQLGSPHLAMLNDHLQKFASGGQVALPPVAGAANAGVVVGSWTPASTVAGPGLLRMAYSAVKSMAKFVGSGMKTVAPPLRENRLRTCGSCEFHTGVRCKLCGCFTSVKAWLPHEHCPVDKWAE